MREIKFRAWAVNEKRFLDEDEIHDLMPFFSGYELMNDYPHAFVLFDETVDLGDDGIEKITEIKWLQFTGLEDKNGKEIYEGDILKFIHMKTAPFVVRWDTLTDFGDWNPKDKAEIIGNIYENPEPLK